MEVKIKKICIPCQMSVSWVHIQKELICDFNRFFVDVRRRPRQNRVTWKTPSSRAFVPLQEPVAVLASYIPHTQMPV
jgi:hypothetical protein